MNKGFCISPTETHLEEAYDIMAINMEITGFDMDAEVNYTTITILCQRYGVQHLDAALDAFRLVGWKITVDGDYLCFRKE